MSLINDTRLQPDIVLYLEHVLLIYLGNYSLQSRVKWCPVSRRSTKSISNELLIFHNRLSFHMCLLYSCIYVCSCSCFLFFSLTIKCLWHLGSIIIAIISSNSQTGICISLVAKKPSSPTSRHENFSQSPTVVIPNILDDFLQLNMLELMLCWLIALTKFLAPLMQLHQWSTECLMTSPVREHMFLSPGVSLFYLDGSRWVL